LTGAELSDAAGRRRGVLGHVPGLTVALFLVPIGAGLIGTALPAFGYLPAIGGHGLSLDPWRALLGQPGLFTTLRLTIVCGLLATLVSLGVVVAFCAAAHGTRTSRRVQAAIAPMLATPHAALAIGLAFLAAPSGWIARWFSPWLTGWERPPDIALVPDPAGLCVVAGLTLKEVPYLLLMTLAALGQVRAGQALDIARSLGYGPVTAWLKVVLPQIYPQIRLPLYAVLAFSLSVVDVALILAPANPPPLGPLVVRWFSDRDLALVFPAAAGACLQFLIVAVAIGLWRLAEIAVARLGRAWIARGHRGGHGVLARRGAAAVMAGLLLASAASVLGMAVWSFAAAWRFPQALPASFTLETWQRQTSGLIGPTWTTIAVGVTATGVALALVLACLENEQRQGLEPSARALWLLYTPLLVPQTAFLFGAQVALVRLDLDATWLAVVWAHLLFVLPYVFLSLADPWRALDPRYARTAACLGASPAGVFWRVKAPMLVRPILFATAVGFAVSAGQYLPTLFAGAGRFATLTTEAVTLASGSDRRVIGVYAFVQTALPLLVYATAIALPPWIYRERRGLRAS
jgi:putative thiamine transport system permease protein